MRLLRKGPAMPLMMCAIGETLRGAGDHAVGLGCGGSHQVSLWSSLMAAYMAKDLCIVPALPCAACTSLCCTLHSPVMLPQIPCHQQRGHAYPHIPSSPKEELFAGLKGPSSRGHILTALPCAV